MSRIAAKFTGDPPTSSAFSTSSAMNKPKKFCTPGEEFFDFVKKLGYQPPKHLCYEHFEYLFQDEKSVNFTRKLMQTLKPQNVCLPEEVEKFERLQNQGFALYGIDLEEALGRRYAINEMYSVQKHKKMAKTEDVKRELQIQEQEKQKLTELVTVFREEKNSWEARQENITKILGIVLHLNSEYEKDIEIDLQLLKEKMNQLETAINARLIKTSSRLCQIDGKSLLEKEERIFEAVYEMIKKHGRNLIIKEASYGIEGDPFNVHNIKKVFAQFEMDFDRLKHCVIYERVNLLACEISLAGQQGQFSNFGEIYQQSVQLSSLGYDKRAKILEETRESIRNYTVAFQRESEELLHSVRESTLAAINEQFAALTNIKARSKKKLQEFFVFASNILKSQKVRITLIRYLVKEEGQLYGRLLTNIEDNLAVSARYTKKLMSKPTVSGMTLEGEILNSLLKYFGITNNKALECISSASTAYSVIQTCLHEAENAHKSIIDDKQVRFQNTYKHILKTEDALRELNSSSSTTGTTKTYLLDAEENIKKQKDLLNNLQQSRNAQAKNHQKLGQDLKATMKKDLLSVNKKVSRRSSIQM